MESLSIKQARKVVLLSQKLPPVSQSGRAVDASLSAVEHLGYIQIDTISAVQRAHHHTFWNRNPRYKPAHLDQLIDDKKVFEYWTHAAAYLPMRDFKFTLPRKLAIANGEQEHWFKRDEGLMKWVRDRISAEGPLMAKDFADVGVKVGEWGSKPAKQALENLFMQGELMISSRKNFHKVYDLTERVLPIGLDTALPSTEELTRFLIIRYLKANGIGQASEICYLLKGLGKPVSIALQEMTSTGELLQLRVGSTVYFAIPSSLEQLHKNISRSKLKILSPFDNLLIQRKRMQTLFDFDYQLECYVPEVKRKYGYFSLPILWNGKFAARMDCSAERKKSLLHIHNLVLEPGLKNTDAFAYALKKELEAFLKFNNCKELELHRITPAGFKSVLQAVIEG